MDIEKLIERLKAKDFERDYDCTPFECGVFGLLDDAATALSMIPTLQAENEKLWAEQKRVKRERDELERFLGELEGAVYTGQYFHLRPMIEKWRGHKED